MFFFLIHDMVFRFHYAKYLALCKSKNVEAKARQPTDWGKNLVTKTQTLDGFVVVVKKAPLPVTKAGIKEYLLELIVDADLVCFVDHFFFLNLLMSFLSVLPLCRAHVVSPPCMLPLSETHRGRHSEANLYR